MSEDIEHLKKTKIKPEPVRDELPSLPTYQYGGPPDEPEAVEAYGGTGEGPAGPFDKDAMREHCIAVLKNIYDPEIPLNIYDLGLIYALDIDDEASIEVQMTLTAPACPVADYLVNEVAQKIGSVPGVKQSHVQLVWDPPWTKDRMSEEALLELGLL